MNFRHDSSLDKYLRSDTIAKKENGLTTATSPSLRSTSRIHTTTCEPPMAYLRPTLLLENVLNWDKK